MPAEPSESASAAAAAADSGSSRWLSKTTSKAASRITGARDGVKSRVDLHKARWADEVNKRVTTVRWKVVISAGTAAMVGAVVGAVAIAAYRGTREKMRERERDKRARLRRRDGANGGGNDAVDDADSDSSAGSADNGSRAKAGAHAAATDKSDPWVAVVHDNYDRPAIWDGLRTGPHEMPGDLVVSSLQKEIRRGHEFNAMRLALELLHTSPAAEHKLWQRLFVISVEDIGLGAPMAPVLVDTLRRGSLEAYERGEGERKLFAVHAVRYLCQQAKDRSSDEAVSYALMLPPGAKGDDDSTAPGPDGRPHVSIDTGDIDIATADARPVIPEYAYDVHTKPGRKAGRGRHHFFTVATKLAPELEGREKAYLHEVLRVVGRDDSRGAGARAGAAE